MSIVNYAYNSIVSIAPEADIICIFNKLFYTDWLNSATKARDRYLAGELSEEEAIAIIYVPTKDELLEQISSDLTVETAAT